ncbi:SMC-Scp complex subunit ScpB [Gemella sp. GH3]|uniref:SMC-Scp complex subunit ScpB n=1 Tax=unclassified Gemella TaxID=2624949 RepID=UPI0015CFE8AC|nr:MULTISPECIES: SMC-Scp complex subunit ScpB [unclassified Gemella]MBF0714394.1 SMC-Scp complex subunit ScpB [Gemella sp. GH3.1]NYS51346.1 SMC-Scp complex subunit ScpB [Gemella sp. GH3]
MLFDENKKLLEALFFVKGEEGISIEYISIFLEVDYNIAENLLDTFKENYNKLDNSLIIKKFGNIYKMLVKADIYNTIKTVLSSKKLSKLSKASLETLAIIAYNQPISKIEIDKIRGVNSDSIVNSLLEKELIVSNKVLDKIGKPKLYETTDYFLDVFGLESLEHLPNVEDKSVESLNEFLNK